MQKEHIFRPWDRAFFLRYIRSQNGDVWPQDINIMLQDLWTKEKRPNFIPPPPPQGVDQEAVELICQNARKTRQKEAMPLWPLLSTKMKLILMKVLKKMTFGQKKHFWPCQWCHCIFLRYTYVTPIFWGQTDLTQWGHISPISWGNSGYVNFSGR